MSDEDLIDRLRDDWRTQRPELDTKPMAVVGRLLLVSEALRQSVASTLASYEIGYTDFDVLATLRRSGSRSG